jgi:hypothetical protein
VNFELQESATTLTYQQGCELLNYKEGQLLKGYKILNYNEEGQI